MDDLQTIRVSVEEEGIATITLDRPEVRNAIDATMVRELTGTLHSLSKDEGLRVLVLRGEGRTFAGGADIAQLRERRTADALRSINGSLFQLVEDFPVPVIAAVEGFALGGGCELALACDVRIAGEGARMGFPEVTLGIFPAAGGTHRLPRLVGIGKAKELVFTGRIVTAEEALAIGLVEHVVPEGDAWAHSIELARQIARNGSLALKVAKMALNAIARGSDPAPIERLGQAILFESQEKFDRMAAFLEKRRNKEKK